MKETLYTLLDLNNGNVIGRGLTAIEVAKAALQEDSGEFDIEGEAYTDHGGGIMYTLWTRCQPGNRPWTRAGFISAAEPREEAERRIFLQVLDVIGAGNWGGLSYLTDAEYDAELAEIMAADRLAPVNA